MTTRGRMIATMALTATTIGAVALMAAPAAPGPKARYWMDVSTTSGFMGGGGNPLAMLRGGGGSAARTLTLRLGSTQAAAGAPAADHFMPAGMELGASVPLVTPQPTRGTIDRTPTEMPENFQRPKGRLLLFWGCGVHAGAGQPVVIDFSKLAQGQMPPHLFSANVPVETGPTAASSRTFGEWPNSKTKRTNVPSGASLIGDHRIAGNYSPEINFALTQDFMPAIRASSAPGAEGSVTLSWQPVDAATGYYAWVMGAQGMGSDGGDMVWWTSAGRQEFGAGLTDWIAPPTVRRLIGEKVVMPPSQTDCTVPAEVKAAAGAMMMTQLYAYGPEADFSYPPRPKNAPASWSPDWTARVRYKSNTSLMLGMPGMGAMTGDDDRDETPAAEPAKKKCKPSLGGFLKGKIC
ncbi:MAG TPA: hypothetical protein VM657_08790 [Sphingomonas sp.]|nr:hypothetical protein [Sphingomonas sp.]